MASLAVPAASRALRHLAAQGIRRACGADRGTPRATCEHCTGLRPASRQCFPYALVPTPGLRARDGQEPGVRSVRGRDAERPDPHGLAIPRAAGAAGETP